MSLRKAGSCLAVLIALWMALPARAAMDPAWTQPFPPFRIAGNLYYVGSADLASYLIVTQLGDILINSDLQSSPPLIRRSVEKLGFHWKDIKILLISHAHFDHCAGSAQILRETGAQYEVMAPDVPVVESGGKLDFAYGHDRSMQYPPAHVDRVLHDGDTVELGGTVLMAHLTAGHTKGTTTWTLDENEDGHRLHVVIVGSPTVNSSYRLVHNHAYPQIASDYEHEFAVLRALPCDIFVGAHGGYFGLREKYARWKAGDRDAFIDPKGYKEFIEAEQQDFETTLRRQSRQR